jgi:hypothetical protein
MKQPSKYYMPYARCPWVYGTRQAEMWFRERAAFILGISAGCWLMAMIFIVLLLLS